MRGVVLRSLVVIGAGGVVLAGVLYVASTVDRRPPEVIGFALTQPLPEEPSRALTTTSLEVGFSEPVDTATAVDALVIAPEVDGSVSWSGSTMIFTPRQPLELATTYTISLRQGVRDLAGNAMTDLPAPYRFETADRPAVVETDPTDGADDVALDAPISVGFSTLMDTASVEASLRLRPTFAHELRWSGQRLEIVPTGPLRADTEYEVEVGEDAFDLSGVPLGSAVSITFRTIAAGLEPAVVVPADRSDGIAPISPIAVIFDEPIDPASVSDQLLVVSPAVAGSLEVVDLDGEPSDDPDDARVLRFVPSGPLPPNTTFDVELAPGLATLDGGGMAEAIRWSFTTGASQATVSNQVTFLSDRSGVANLWAMNPDGTAARQLSAELRAITEFAVAPDGGGFVLADGRRLILLAADGTERRVLTPEGFLEFDPAYAPDGQRLAFARADASTGRGLGIWERELPGGDAVVIATPTDPAASPTATPGDGAPAPDWRRAPRYAPDGEALAYVDPTGSVGIVDLGSGEDRRATFVAQAPPLWLPDGSAVLLTGRTEGGAPAEPSLEPPIEPLHAGPSARVGVLARAGSVVRPSGFGPGAAAAAVAADGRIAYLRPDGSLRIADGPEEIGRAPAGVDGDRIGEVAFGPDDDAVVVVVLPEDAESGAEGRIERLELSGGEREVLVNDGWHPRWLP